MNEEEFFDALEMAYQEDETESVSNVPIMKIFIECQPTVHVVNCCVNEAQL